MKIGYLLDDSLDKPDGVQQYVRSLGTWMSAHGHEVHYLAGQTGDTDLPNVHSLARNIPVSFNGNRLTIPLPVSKRTIRALLDELKLDVIHVQTPHSPFFAHRVVCAAPERTKIVATFHILPYSWIVSAGVRLLTLLLRPSLKRIHKLYANSPPTERFAEKVYGMEADVLPCPIDVGRFSRAKPLERYQDVPTIMYLNRLVKRKGAMHLLVAVKYIKDNKLYEKPFRVLVCGKGEESTRLQAFIDGNDLSDVVTLEGFISEADKPRYLASSDIAIYPSTGGESFGIVLLEGMAAGKGVVLAGNNQGYSAVMSPFQNQLFDPKDTRQFAELIVRFLKDPGTRVAASVRQKSYVKDFDVTVVCEVLLNEYKERPPL